MEPMKTGQRGRIIAGDHAGERGTVQARTEGSKTAGVDPAPTAELPTPVSYVYVVRLDSITEPATYVRVDQDQIEPID